MATALSAVRRPRTRATDCSTRHALPATHTVSLSRGKAGGASEAKSGHPFVVGAVPRRPEKIAGESEMVLLHVFQALLPLEMRPRLGRPECRHVK